MRPFLLWLFGVIAGIVTCEAMSIGRSATNDWVFWGAMAEVYRYINLLEVERQGLEKS